MNLGLLAGMCWWLFFCRSMLVICFSLVTRCVAMVDVRLGAA